MSSIINKVKASAASRTQKPSSDPAPPEPSYSIQPHPAKSNDPADFQPREPGGGLASSDPLAAHRAPGPVIPSSNVMNSLEKPLSRDELSARTAELNK